MSNLDIIKKGYQAYADGDLETFMDLLDENILWVNQSIPSYPTHGTFRGIVGIVDFFRKVADALEMQDMQPEHYFDGGDKIVVTGKSRLVLRTNGNEVHNTWVHVYTMENEKITSFKSWNDVAAMATSMGYDALYDRPLEEA